MRDNECVCKKVRRKVGVAGLSKPETTVLSYSVWVAVSKGPAKAHGTRGSRGYYLAGYRRRLASLRAGYCLIGGRGFNFAWAYSWDPHMISTLERN